MKIYNTLTRRKEEFVPLVPDEVKIYACGPTVYNFIHIGNARPICVFDVLRRYLEYRGMKVTFVQNFTDIDDKIIRRANEEHSDTFTVARRYIGEYRTDAEGLNVRPATVHPLATENIDGIISMISSLVEKGYAYPAPNGDVYFRTGRDKGYGKLSHQPLDDLRSGARVAVGEQKEDPLDFALWKGAKPGEPSWASPWGEGRPGWHIECSVMANRYLGKTIDIHCGGQDLIFPHHENEIAQSECCNGVPFARYWMHNGYINIDNRKMSKSLGNFFTVRDVAQKYGYEPIRFLMLSAHYRSPINYSGDVMEQCRASLERLYTCRGNLAFLFAHAAPGEKEGEKAVRRRLETYQDQFIVAMEDDLNTADALSALFDLAKDINSSLTPAAAPSKELCSFALNLFNELAGVLGLLYAKNTASADGGVEKMIALRQKARAEKNWAEADRIRDELKARGVVLEDTPQGVRWHRAGKA